MAIKFKFKNHKIIWAVVSLPEVPDFRGAAVIRHRRSKYRSKVRMITLYAHMVELRAAEAAVWTHGCRRKQWEGIPQPRPWQGLQAS